MKCPVDKNDMIVVEQDKIEIDHCLQCAGVWLDSGELDLLVSHLKAGGADLSADNLITPHQAKTNEARRKCPVCGRKMEKVRLGGNSKVLIDSCPQRDGLWFDGGELQQTLRELHVPETPAARDIIAFLDGAFHYTHSPEKINRTY
jgi:Zn-finger nucleic acid-binding protein